MTTPVRHQGDTCGVKPRGMTLVTRKEIALPDELAVALDADASAREALEALRPSCQRDYAARVSGATTPEQRERHVKRAVELALAWKARHPEAGRRRARITG